MYYPYIRGKQFELVMLREMAPKMAKWGFVPIIEPVKGNFPALKKTLEALIESNCEFILIANPNVGELKKDNSLLWSQIICDQLKDYRNYSVGYNLTSSDNLKAIRLFFQEHSLQFAIVHCGFSDGKGLSELLTEIKPRITKHIFVNKTNTTLYRKHFKTKGVNRVLIEDGFVSRNNRDYPQSEPFSELYLTHTEFGCDAFGDFLIVGSDYKEGGGPAYAIAIHLTYVDSAADDAIAIKHYISDRIDGQQDPAGKFQEALRKLCADVNSKNTQILKTTAVNEYLHLNDKLHFPGLGYTKKLSMQHHLELMAHLLDKEV